MLWFEDLYTEFKRNRIGRTTWKYYKILCNKKVNEINSKDEKRCRRIDSIELEWVCVENKKLNWPLGGFSCPSSHSDKSLAFVTKQSQQRKEQKKYDAKYIFQIRKGIFSIKIKKWVTDSDVPKPNDFCEKYEIMLIMLCIWKCLYGYHMLTAKFVWMKWLLMESFSCQRKCWNPNTSVQYLWTIKPKSNFRFYAKCSPIRLNKSHWFRKLFTALPAKGKFQNRLFFRVYL